MLLGRMDQMDTICPQSIILVWVVLKRSNPGDGLNTLWSPPGMRAGKERLEVEVINRNAGAGRKYPQGLID
jgi:hypothetical protein